MFPLIFVVSVRRNFGVCALFLGIHPELKRLCVRKQVKTKKKGLHPELKRFLCPKAVKDLKKGLHPQLKRFLWPKSLLSVLLL